MIGCKPGISWVHLIHFILFLKFYNSIVGEGEDLNFECLMKNGGVLTT